MKDKYEEEKVNREDRVTGGGKKKKERKEKKKGNPLPVNRSTASTSPLLSAANNDLAPLSAEPSSHSPVHEKASRVRRGGSDVAGICPFHLPLDIFGHGASVEVGGERGKEETGLDEKLYCIYCEMKFLRGDYSRCVLWQPSGNPPSRSFVATKTFLASSIRDKRATLLFRSIFFFSVEHVRPFVSFSLSPPLSLFSSFPLVHGYRMAIVEIFIVHGRGEEGDRLTVRAGSSFLTNWSAGNCPSPGATCWDPG